MNEIILVAVQDPFFKAKLKYVSIPDPPPDGEAKAEEEVVKKPVSMAMQLIQ